MKKRLFFALGVSLSVSLFAAPELSVNSQGLDEQLFLQPNLAETTATVSMNIGSKLPSTTHIVSNELCKEIGLGAHFKNMAQKLEENAQVIVTAPASYGVVFTDDSCSQEDVTKHIQEVLEQINSNIDPEAIKTHLNQLTEVNRATFAIKEGKLELVTDEKQLHIGEQVWRKNPNGVEAAVYHSEEEYLVTFAAAGFKVEEIKRPCFFGEVKYKMHKASLKEGKRPGHAYVENHPFTIFYLVKKAA